MIKKIGLLFALCVLLGTQCVWASSVWVRFYAQATVSGPDIHLGDIAEVGGDAARAAELRQLKISNAPSAGRKIVWTPEILNMRLAAAGGNYADVQWQIPPSITVTTAAQALTGERLVEEGIAAIQEKIGASETREFLIEPLAAPSDAVLPTGTVRYEVDLPNGVRYNMPTSVAVSVYINDRLWKKTAFRVRVRVFDRVVVAGRALAARQILTAGDVRLERMEIGDLAAGYLTDAGFVVGMTARRAIPAGMAVTKTMIEKPVLIRQLAMVNIVSSVGSARAQVAGQAMQDGSEGQVIRVRNIKSGKIVSAKVVDETTVEVLT